MIGTDNAHPQSYPSSYGLDRFRSWDLHTFNSSPKHRRKFIAISMDSMFTWCDFSATYTVLYIPAETIKFGVGRFKFGVDLGWPRCSVELLHSANRKVARWKLAITRNSTDSHSETIVQDSLGGTTSELKHRETLLPQDGSVALVFTSFNSTTATTARRASSQDVRRFRISSGADEARVQIAIAT